MTPSLPQLLLIAVLTLILFRSRDIPRLFADRDSGIRAFKRNIKAEER